MKLMVATLLLLGLWSHSVEGYKMKLFHRYAKIKILEQCYGPELMKEWHEWMSGRVQECQDSRATRSADDSHELDSLEDLHAALLSPEELTARKQKKEKKLRMLNCLMDAMNVTTTADGSVDTAPIVSYVKKTKMDTELMNDLVDRIEQCGKMKMGKSCRPAPAAADPALPAKIAFMRCEARARLQTCMVRDLNKNKDLFKMTAIEDLFSGRHGDDIDDIYDDDDHDDHDDDDDV